MRRGNDYDGILISLEGIDGCGKTSAVETIVTECERAEKDFVTTKEPSDLWTGEVVYGALTDDEMVATTDFMLFCADRAHHIEERIKPALEAGKVVITDRYADSTVAYQTDRVADELGMDVGSCRQYIRRVFEPFHISPDRTIYLDISVDTSLERCDQADKFENRQTLEAAKREYDRLYSECDVGIRIIDAEQRQSAVDQRLRTVTRAALYQRSGKLPESRDDNTYADAIDES